ncbi:nucleoside phosphatase family-domain-containing protein [Abortiporus biennis]|nr:nucleoside phosphatase family-domain-containing protein [Abortiporus biennis]
MFSPRSTNYERLEGGLGPSRMSGLRRFGWKKFAIGAVVIIGLVWVFGPRRQDLLPKKYNPSLGLGNVDFEPPPPPPEPEPTHHTTVIGGGTPTAPDTSKAQQPQPRPTSLETDPDVTKTVYCTSPHKPGVPLVQFALMIDAGSTGSRIHIYKFNNCGASPSYEYEVFKQIQPGLSSYRGRPVEAAQSLDPLLDEALKVVPQSFQSCTPVAVKATAGLRLLGSEESESILEAVRHRLAEKYPFSLHGGKDSVVIMDGKDEGVFAWVTANYLLNTIRSDTPPGTTPYAVLDLGGASTQIVFEPSFDMSKPDNTLEEGEHKYDLKFGGKEHVLYQHSYLGYGLKKARGSVHRLVEFMGSFHKPGKDVVVGNPCLARGTTKLVTIEDERIGKERNVTMVGEDIGGFEACNRVVELVMAKDAICEVKPCSFNGVYQPSLLETFPTGKILLLSYFYDRVNPLISSSSSSSPIQISTIATLAQQVCLGRTSWKEHFGHDDELMKELEDRPEWCLDLTFMHALLRLGYEFSSNRAVELGKKIDGTELGWCLGATIAMVGADLKCRV